MANAYSSVYSVMVVNCLGPRSLRAYEASSEEGDCCSEG